MSDLEMISLCAEAMGINAHEYQWENGLWIDHANGSRTEYDPLHDDTQAMALVKKFHLCSGHTGHVSQDWNVSNWEWEIEEPAGYRIRATSKDLNRAIVECVAKMQRRSKLSHD